MARLRFIYAVELLDLIKAYLKRIITIVFGGLLLHYAAGSCLHHRHRDDRSVLRENLGHAELLSNQSKSHGLTSKSPNIIAKKTVKSSVVA